MFAKHLMASTARIASKTAHVPSDIGEHLFLNSSSGVGVATNYGRATYELDRSAATLFFTSVAPTFPGAMPGSDGAALLAPSNESAVTLWGTGPSGPTTSLATYAKPTGTIAHLYGRGACRVATAGSAFSLQHVDLATGQAYPAVTVPRLEYWPTGDDLFVGNATRSGLAGTTFYTLLAAGNGRHARASIPRQVHEDAPAAIFLRMRAAATPEAVTWSPFTRPTTTDTRVRGYTLATGSTYPGNRQPRHGLSVAPHSANVRQVEISASTGTTMLDGQTVTRHTLTGYLSVLIGFMTASKAKGIGFITTQRTDYVATYAVLQYLDASGQPTGEFVMESSGTWTQFSYSDGAVASGGFSIGLPLLSMPSYLVVDAGSKPVFLDYAGSQVSEGTYPPGSGGGTTKVLVCLANADILVVPANRYATTRYSTDYGKTWGSLLLWGARGTPNPGAGAPPSADVARLSTALPLFVA